MILVPLPEPPGTIILSGMFSLVPRALRVPDLAVDLGTAVTRVAPDEQNLREHPSQARSTSALGHGVIVSRQAAVEVLRPMLSAWRRAPFAKVRALACAPSDVSHDERHSIADCVRAAGASSVAIVPEPLAAAVGAGIDIASNHVKFLVDLGGGVTDCALLYRGQVVTSFAARVGCSDLRQTIQHRIRETLAIKLSDEEAERLLRMIGLGELDSSELPIRGQCPRDGVIQLASLREAMFPVVYQILSAVDTLLREIPPRFGAEVIEDGIFLTGGGALLRGLPAVIQRHTGIDVRVAPDPLRAVIHGACAMLPIAASLRLWDLQSP
ncbi:MAG TPA: rod shape-determining protein [Chthoniobacteraceae bacterium]|nr:rod shape-determining protein [Chthoniobacteraceae bacterium]